MQVLARFDRDIGPLTIHKVDGPDPLMWRLGCWQNRHVWC